MIKVENLKVKFSLDNQTVEALKGVSFHLNQGEILAIVGESGSGKSVSCNAIMGLLPSYATVEGNIFIDEKNIKDLSKEDMRRLRGSTVSMVFQEPSAVLNPLLTVGDQILETVLAHKDVSYKEAKDIVLETMEAVKIPDPERRFYQYPHELSGGLKQRVVIAAAVVNKPKYILADEPTTALDVTTAAGILSLFQDLKQTYNIGILFITHDLGVVAQIADRVVVMYKGEIMEEGDVYQIFDNPKSDYTKKLLSSRVYL
ncbi:dipeptide transport ATP-binding protein DppD [Sulfurihydrogenibium azorense Az-Fu1]|uniref:Dipeptide transport ATP-binding protein DppD n=1 Tax=Sulfurihydrogenibium azorense (strain DSM 15241 / OCM 825 / Az-Fu1) TaxID=204536 RepID=C1DWC7_SULAA|nr:ABC transporter ATP-binding protein [Sulfurihydrogenibium azorense]ACN99763.1 dipeptide transport ATP-binding protein DppD [Sulfurihydrogenibium azorense Az-Fu1]